MTSENNPWGLTHQQALAMDCMVQFGDPSIAAAQMNIKLSTYRTYQILIGQKMPEQKTLVSRCIAWDRWRRSDSNA
jgi:hypothetical protein